MKRSEGLKRTPLRRRAKGRKQPDELERMAEFKSAAWEQRCCLMCADVGGSFWHAHHVVTQQYVRRADGDLWDPRNAMRLCTICHDAHHNRSRPIPLSAVPEAALAFADELLGSGRAEAFFERYYGPRRWIGY